MILFSVWLVLVMFVVSSILMAGDAEATDLSGVEYIEVTVEKGDTLWQIASEFGPYTSTRQSIYAIMEFNQMDSKVVYPGEVLRVPVLEEK